MRLKRNVFLVGTMGAGKSSVGRRLAKALRAKFLDTDHVIEETTGVRIPVIFEHEGEEGFRRRESKVMRELALERNLVLATGGGAILKKENRKVLRRSGFVIYLCATPEHLYERTKHDTNRPLLQTSDPMQTIKDLMNKRDPLYRDVADMVLETQDKPIYTVVKEIEKKLYEKGIIE